MCHMPRMRLVYHRLLDPLFALGLSKSKLGLVAVSELKAGLGAKWKKGSESESKAGPGPILRTGLGSKTSVETGSKLKVCFIFQEIWPTK
ncbi:hypothetical protein EVAR_54000_1 [Eumeta japonica]|uniref:Uncharacterized protein n=1 Tax=Eumeta variegata TaxID=151549 RepID=A0A4C1YVB4_EUMVA|nr:hypothetical protein EVAR_54000_1 [Eumeta japonica]